MLDCTIKVLKCSTFIATLSACPSPRCYGYSHGAVRTAERAAQDCYRATFVFKTGENLFTLRQELIKTARFYKSFLGRY